MKELTCTCKQCGRVYSYIVGEDVGYARDLCGPYCDGLFIGRSTIDTLTQRIAEHEETESTLRKILSALVELKDMKDSSGKTEEYRLKQPVAWKVARLALTQGEDP